LVVLGIVYCYHNIMTNLTHCVLFRYY